MYDSYTRKVDDILTLIGSVGGLSGSLMGIGAVIVGLITKKMLMSKIINKIYHIRRYDTIDKLSDQEN